MKYLIIFSVAALLCASCVHVNKNYQGGKNSVKGTGSIITKDFDFKDFHSVCINGNADVRFVQSDDWAVSLRTQENIPEYLDYKVEDGVLVIEAKDRRTIRAEVYDLTVKAPVLRRVEVNGASDFDIEDGLRSDEDLTIVVNGAGDLTFKGVACRDLSVKVNGAADLEAADLDVREVRVRINGAGDVVLSGKAGDADLSVNGAGDIDARRLVVAGEVNKQASGVAKIKL